MLQSINMNNDRHFTLTLNTKRKLLVPETKNLSFLQTKPRTQQRENEEPRTAFSRSLLPRPQQSNYLKT